MAIRRAGEFVEALRADGVSGALPVAIVENATRPAERVFTATVDTLAAVVEREAVQSPALLIVGNVVKAQTPVLKTLLAFGAAQTQFVNA
jgi:uroporphyrin-III C-methyltransferase